MRPNSLNAATLDRFFSNSPYTTEWPGRLTNKPPNGTISTLLRPSCGAAS